MICKPIPAGVRIPLIATGLLVAGCSGLSSQDVSQIRKARDMYNVGQYEQAEQVLSPIISRRRGETGVGDALYVRGLTYFRRNMMTEGERDLATARSLASDNATRALIDSQLGYLRFSAGNYEAAARHFSMAVPHLPGDADRAGITYQYGMALLRTGNFSRARDVFQTIPSKYPDSKFADMARKKAAWGGNYFTIQCGAFSNAARAEEESLRWRQRGFEGSVTRGTGDQQQLYIVFIGRFPTYSAARAALGTIRAGSADAFIVP